MRSLLLPVVTVVLVGAMSHTSARETIPADIVLYASDATTLNGTWQRVNDATAAGGVRVFHPDAGAPKVTTASATPRDYFELSFQAEAGRAYRLWMRANAQNNSYTNDSVCVQFSGAVDASHAPAFRIGSSSATAVILENCSGCGVAEWGWQDNEYGGVALGPEIRFAATGAQTLRIQGREDGISIDQIVLSSAAYFTTPPGAFENDTRILQKTTGTASTGATGPVGFTLTPYLAGNGFDSAAAVDVNGDSRPDLVGIFDNEPVTVVSALNMGNRAFDVVQATETAGGPDTVNTVAVDDFNRDGRKDLLYLYRSHDSLITVPGDGAGHFDLAARVETSFAENVDDFAAVDFNKDGILDVVTIEPERNAAVIHRGDGTGRFSFLSFAPTAAGPGYVAAGDVDGDGCADAVTISRASDTITILPGDCTGRFRQRSDLFAGFAPRAIALGDLNGDSRLDIVVANAAGLSVYTRTASGEWAARVDVDATKTFDATVPDRALTIVDVNGDGWKDLVVGLVHVGANRTGVWTSISVVYADGSGFGAPEEFSSRGAGVPVAADFDADGRIDVVTTASSSVFWNEPLTENRQPVADAGTDLTAPVSQQATLTLSSPSADPDAHLLTYAWTDASGELISSGALARPFEVAQKPAGTYTFTLTVDDLHGSRQSDTVTVTLQNDATGTNTPPVAHANVSQAGVWHYEQQFQDEPDPNTFFWNTSTDADGDPLSAEWRDETGAVLNLVNGVPRPGLRPGLHTITLTVRDGRGGVSQDSVTVNVLKYEEIYITNGYKELVKGAWQKAEQPFDSGGPDRIVVRDTDRGAPKVTTPLAAPGSYAEYSFVADPTVEYKLWIRLKAQSNFYGNDSVWVQFTGATDASGNAVFRTGTASGLAVVLEECSGCGISEWGWRDDAWGAAGAMSSTFVRFPAGGIQTIRIQTREDGVSIDQIAFSAGKYKTTRPGTVKNDTTFLPFTAMWGT